MHIAIFLFHLNFTNLTDIIMKKVKMLLLVLFIAPLMSFEGCYLTAWIIYFLNAVASGEYAYGDKIDPTKYSIMVGDNGTIWRSHGEDNIVFEPRTSGTTQKLNGVRISNNYFQDDAVVVGNNGTIVVSTNSGNTWVNAPQLTTANLYGTDHNYYIYAVGDNGTIVHCTYFGGTWSLQNSGTTRNLKAVTINAQFNSRVIAVGEKGTILRTMNGGFNWDNMSLPDTTFDFCDISQKGLYYSGNIICAVGTNGRIYKTTDFGDTWQQKSSGTTNTLRKVYFHTLDSGAVAGDNGTIRLTTNGGETWYQDPNMISPASRNYKSITFVNRQKGTFSALSDTLFFVSQNQVTVGIQPVNSELPTEFALAQNYPNPFNPVTKIMFKVASPTDVKLTIFDINGKEVQTLLNEKKGSGVYEVTWDAAGFTSGVYFYRIQTQDFTQTKKMIMIK